MGSWTQSPILLGSDLTDLRLPNQNQNSNACLCLLAQQIPHASVPSAAFPGETTLENAELRQQQHGEANAVVLSLGGTLESSGELLKSPEPRAK